MKISGVDENGKYVISEIFPMVDSKGIPLDIVLDKIKTEDYTPNLLDFFDNAILAGWNPDTAYSSIITSLYDIYGEEYSKEWDRRFKMIITNRNKIKIH